MAPAAGEEASTSARPAAVQELPIEGKTVKALTLLSLKRTFDLFAANMARRPRRMKPGAHPAAPHGRLQARGLRCNAVHTQAAPASA